ncbi:MAG: A/G-specific adenine glycosylase [Gammaproteobacteria bacterium]|nr:A/G-specific adenine glycosylase [Gammaproteobacteria bacterium]
MNRKDSFSTRLLSWYRQYGRNDLPWQQNPTVYRVWISEIMLQQTQVRTVIPYYQRFMESFPNVMALAQASLDEVLHLWTGLGYYARARNLHRAAQHIWPHHQGRFPIDLDSLMQLPGIGRSTASAILALTCNQRHAILDGNVTRVLARYHAVSGWPGKAIVKRTLWAIAERHLPSTEVAQYTQAIMDLGATVCTRARPRCDRCPLRNGCKAHARGQQSRFPGARPRKRLPKHRTIFVILQNHGGDVLLERRPLHGIWGGLWSFPECPPGVDVEKWCRATLGCHPETVEYWSMRRHTFSHFHLDITPVHILANDKVPMVDKARVRAWYDRSGYNGLGLPAPVKHLLGVLDDELGEIRHDTHGPLRKAG